MVPGQCCSFYPKREFAIQPCNEAAARADTSAMGTIMAFNKLNRTSVEADTLALGAIKRPPAGREMLRCAQHDRVVTPTGGWMYLLMSIIGPYCFGRVEKKWTKRRHDHERRFQ